MNSFCGFTFQRRISVVKSAKPGLHHEQSAGTSFEECNEPIDLRIQPKPSDLKFICELCRAIFNSQVSYFTAFLNCLFFDLLHYNFCFYNMCIMHSAFSQTHKLMIDLVQYTTVMYFVPTVVYFK